MARRLKSWTIVALTSLALAAVGIFVAPTAAHAGDYVYIINYNSHKCVEAATSGNDAFQAWCDQSIDPHQVWNIYQPLSGGGLWIQNIETGNCLRASNTYSAYAFVGQDECNVNTVRQRWYRVHISNGIYAIKNYHTKRCLYVIGAKLDHGAHLSTASCGTTYYRHYRWYFSDY